MSYQNAVIYKIECNDINVKECYIGSTKDFVGRRYNHKSKYKMGSNLKVYQFIRNNGGWENWTMKSIINYPCKNRMELEIKEQEIIKTFDNTLNCVNAYTSIEYKIEYKKQWDVENTEKRKEQAKQYRIDNLEKIKEQKKQYYIDNTEKIKARQNEKIQCDCGRWTGRGDMAKHRKTKIHTDFLKNK